MSGAAAVRRVAYEWRRKGGPKRHFNRSPLGQYVLGQLRRWQLSPEQFSKNPRQLPHVANTYADYLEATRRLQGIHSTYQKGEISIADAANRVGLNLPLSQPPPS